MPAGGGVRGHSRHRITAFLLGRVGSGEQRDVVERFGAAWERSNYKAMYDQLDADSSRRAS